MNTTLTETEQKILDAAKKVFVKKGMTGARMQEIADEAGINKSLLHYYFRSKDKLFEAVFQSSLGEFFPKVLQSILSDNSMFDKIEIFVQAYSELLEENPYLPVFIISEVSRNPENIVRLFEQKISIVKETSMPVFMKAIQELVKEGKIRETDPRNLIVNMIAMVLFPVIAKPILKTILFDNDDEAYEKFIQQRPEHISQFIINSIKVA